MPAPDRTAIQPIEWHHPRILPAGFTALIDRFWAERGAKGVLVAVHVESNGRPRTNPDPQPRRDPPWADVWFVPTHHMSAVRHTGGVAGACWLFAQWRLLADALITELQFAATSNGYESPATRRARLDGRLADRQAFYDRVLAADDRLGQPRSEIGGLVGVLWRRRLAAWRTQRRTFRAGGGNRANPAEYPREVLDDLRAYECGGQHTLSHLVDDLIKARYPRVIPFGETEEQVKAVYRFLRNQRYLLRYHLLNACPALGIWRTVLARTPGRDGSRRVYHFFTAGERARLLAYVTPRLPAPKAPPWDAWARPGRSDGLDWGEDAPESPF